MPSVPRSKVPMTWTELILIVLIVLSGMGLWGYVETRVLVAAQHELPRLETFQDRRQVATLQAELAAKQQELAGVQQELVAQAIALERVSAKIEVLTDTYSDLATWANLPTQAPLVPASVWDGYAKIQLELDAQTREQNALDAQLAELIAGTERPAPPATPSPQDAAQQERIKALQAEIDKGKAALTAQTAERDALLHQNPVLAQLLADVAPVSLSTLETFLDAQVDRETASGLFAQLETRSQALTQTVADATGSLSKAQRQAEVEYAREQDRFDRRIKFRTLLWTWVGVLVLLIVCLLLEALLERLQRPPICAPLVCVASSLVLLVLLAYQVAGFAGAAVAGLLAFALVVLILPNLEAKPKTAGAAVEQVEKTATQQDGDTKQAKKDAAQEKGRTQ